MKRNSLLFLALLSLLLLCKVFAWEEKDFEIFDAHDAITKLRGPDATFYNVLEVEPNASVDTLNKAYRKISLSLHPDKTTNKKDRELYTQINLIINILRDKNARKRYDYFLKVGVPKWRGTGYFFSRYKPSIKFAGITIVVGICIMQILLSWTNYYTKKYRISSAKKELDILTFQEVRKILRKEDVEITKEMFKNSTPSEILTTYSQYYVFEEVEKPKITDIIIIKLPWSIISGIIHFPQTIEKIKQGINEYKELIERERQLDREREGQEDENEDIDEEEDGNNENVEPSETKPKRRKPKRRVLTEEQKQKILEQKKLNKQRMEEEQERRKKAREAASATAIDPFSGNANAFLPKPLPKKKKDTDDEDSDEIYEEEEEEVNEEEQLKTDPWDAAEYAVLVRLTKKYPAGTPGRWIRIGMEMRRSVDDVSYNAKLLSKDPKLALVQ
eukprot:jgi/Orpsp1_1/1177302/evm.model.c7180000060881.2